MNSYQKILFLALIAFIPGTSVFAENSGNTEGSGKKDLKEMAIDDLEKREKEWTSKAAEYEAKAKKERDDKKTQLCRGISLLCSECASEAQKMLKTLKKEKQEEVWKKEKKDFEQGIKKRINDIYSKRIQLGEQPWGRGTDKNSEKQNDQPEQSTTKQAGAPAAGRVELIGRKDKNIIESKEDLEKWLTEDSSKGRK